MRLGRNGHRRHHPVVPYFGPDGVAHGPLARHIRVQQHGVVADVVEVDRAIVHVEAHNVMRQGELCVLVRRGNRVPPKREVAVNDVGVILLALC